MQSVVDKFRSCVGTKVMSMVSDTNDSPSLTAVFRAAPERHVVREYTHSATGILCSAVVGALLAGILLVGFGRR